MLCRDTFDSNEAKVVCNQLGYVTNAMGKLLYIMRYIMALFVAGILDIVSNPLALPKHPVSVMFSFSCAGNETNISDCIDSEPAFVSLCNNSQSAYIEVTCPGMIALAFHII